MERFHPLEEHLFVGLAYAKHPTDERLNILGHEMLTELAQGLHLPVVALLGLTQDDLEWIDDYFHPAVGLPEPDVIPSFNAAPKKKDIPSTHLIE